MSDQQNIRKHPMIDWTPSAILLNNGRDKTHILTYEEAISLGIALMETALFLKQQRKDQENAKV